MCGIYGAIGAIFSGSPSSLLRHRGPDGHGEHAFDVASRYRGVLGHRRLAILDLSSAGAQPMTNEDGSIWVTFNGEIYNFVELKAQLEILGHRFRSHSDTEVLVHGYEEWGEALPCHLRGMFAFAIWDAGRSALFLARDRIGKKPLFYHGNHQRFVFGSEIKAVLAAEGVPREPDPEALDHFLTYFYFPHPYTAFRGIAKLPPATWLKVTISASGGLEIKTRRYWDLLEQSSDISTLSADAAVARTRALLTQAIQRRLLSDVPLGAFLSGGLDSSSIVALSATELAHPLSAFSVSFPGHRHYDESDLARQVAERFAQSHTLLPVEFSAAEWLPKVVRHFDEPFGNPTAVLQYHLTRAARQHVTVALSGDGGDEALLGYYRYRGARWAQRLRRLPGPLKQMLQSSAAMLPEATSGWQSPRRVREFLEFGSLPEAEAYLHWVGYFSPADKARLYAPQWQHSLGDGDAGDFLRGLYREAEPLDGANRLSFVDCFSFLCCNVLEYTDRMSMANSLEVRCPFTDPDFFAAMLAAPVAYKLQRGQGKALLRQAMRRDLPNDVFRQKKRGFSPPLERWMKQQLRPLLASWLGSKAVEARGMFRPSAVQELRQAHDSGRRDNSVRLWGLLALEAWFRLYFDGTAEEELQAEIGRYTRSRSANGAQTLAHADSLR